MSKTKNCALVIELNPATVKDETRRDANVYVMTGDAGETNWIARVWVGRKQAVIAFPKFGTVAIGFQVEKADWNVNLPASLEAAEIYEHIKKNKGSDSISKEKCVEAIALLQPVAAAWLGRPMVNGRMARDGEVPST